MRKIEREEEGVLSEDLQGESESIQSSRLNKRELLRFKEVISMRDRRGRVELRGDKEEARVRTRRDGRDVRRGSVDSPISQPKELHRTGEVSKEYH